MHVLRPLLAALEQAVGYGPDNSMLRDTIASIEFETLPVGHRKDKRLEFRLGQGADATVVPYTAFVSGTPYVAPITTRAPVPYW